VPGAAASAVARAARRAVGARREAFWALGTAAARRSVSTAVEPAAAPGVEDVGISDIFTRLARTITVAIDREEADSRVEREEAGARRLPVESRLRIATFFALACGVLFLPVEGASVRQEPLASLLVLYVVHAVLTSTILIASFTRRGERHADSLALFLVAGHGANVLAYTYLWPRFPGLSAGILTCLLVGNTVLFSWSTGRALALGTAFSVGFVLIGMVGAPASEAGPDTAVAEVVVLVGAATAVGCARLLALLRASLAEGQQELRSLSARLMSAQEEERGRLARELHDEFGQSLTAVSAYLWLIERQPEDLEGLRHRSAEARRVITKTLGAMRELSQLLRPPVLDTLGLIPSLEGLLQNFTDQHQIATSLSNDPLPHRLPVEMETALYRITQEALTNVARHARARRVRVGLACMKEELRLEIEDDGVGFPSPNGQATPLGNGLVGIRERVRALGGRLVLSSRPGASLEIRVPFDGAA
jgi:signal transduction histidine kinase